MEVQSYNYKKTDIQAGILHIGVGNFHRAHQEFYINQLLAQEDQRNWAFCGVSLLPFDEKIVKGLRSQDLDYTLTICGRDGKNEVQHIGALKELIWGEEEPDMVSDKIAEETIKIITLTITEGGYNLEKKTNKFDLDNEAVQYDIAHPHQPKTVFGFVAEGLRKRKEKIGTGITILSCDNLQHNGNTARNAFLTFIEVQDKVLYEWAKEHVSFPNSMVDRITPATTSADIGRLNMVSGVDDKVPVYCEDFIQWVIEDNFVAGRPALERVGVEFTNDVTAYENMKLNLLNASHTLLSYPSFLKGYRKVDEAMLDADILKFVSDFMDIDITPYVPAPPHTDLGLYKKTLLERFANKAVSDQVSRLCFDGVSKFPVYIMPNLIKMIKDHKVLERLAFLFASYRHYLKYKVDEKGQTFEIAEPWLTKEDADLVNSDNALDFLHLSAFKVGAIYDDTIFVANYQKAVKSILEKGISATLSAILQ